ncbi:MAG: peptidoglycan-binding domain-containing protein [Pseudomonadota bacterium]
MNKLLTISLCTLLVSLLGCKSAMVAYQEATPQDRVVDVQQSLITLGYLEAGSADGALGPKTEQAIKEFQNANGMVADGQMSYTLYNRAGLAATESRNKANRSSVAVNETSTSSKVKGGGTNVSGQSWDECDYAVWEGRIPNLADLFACDRGRAIAVLSQGAEIEFEVGAINFRGGQLTIEDWVYTTPVQQTKERLKQKYSSRDFLSVSGTTPYSFTCALPAEYASKLKEGDVTVFEAKLQGFSGKSGTLQCN